jgi:Lipopolysaccharide kinase (Kdo/WaaP) family
VKERTIERGGWIFKFDDSGADGIDRERLVMLALEVVAGRAARQVRRSRAATTRVAEFGDAAVDIFFKILEPPRGAAAIRRWFRGAGAEHIARISSALAASAIGAAPVLLTGREPARGREIVVTARVAGFMVPRHLGPRRESLARKRLVLDALGAEVARLHRAGFIHGDLTPFNVFVMPGEPPPIVFIDHERTRRPRFAFARARLRNLVQLGHFDLAGLSNTDRMRVWRSYCAAGGAPAGTLRRVAKMLTRRIARDRARERDRPVAIVETGKLREG